MSYQLHQTEGIVLGRWPRGEADAVLRLYTSDYGSVTLLAKGIRLEKSRLRGAVDLFSRSHIGFISGKETYRLTYAQLQNGHASLHASFARYRAAGHAADMFRRAVADGEADSLLWLLLEETFLLFSGDAFQIEKLPLYLRSFEVKFLKQLGYLPELMPRSVRMVAFSPLGFSNGAFSAKEMRELSLFLRPLLQYALTQRWEIASAYSENK
ncbi:MAG: DNA repair protein RecO [Parcubacteria group bacterium Gr01-1014_70]|nr:MAG: DNA repair protein RecO [Parcubacteria group bacterium Gr01-1014_70]